MSASISIVPWPHYSEHGEIASWEVRVDVDGKFHGTLTWSTSLARFRKDNHIWRLRRGAPKVYREAVELMVDFCSKLQQQRDTRKRDTQSKA